LPSLTLKHARPAATAFKVSHNVDQPRRYAAAAGIASASHIATVIIIIIIIAIDDGASMSSQLGISGATFCPGQQS
jgi:hypothetical protein